MTAAHQRHQQPWSCPRCGNKTRSVTQCATECQDRTLFPELAPKHDPGGKLLPMLPGMTGDAKFAGTKDECRLWLSRWWGPNDGPYMLSLGMNPSTARHDVDDPTIRRDIAFAQREGMAGFYKVNAVPYRATHPKNIVRPHVSVMWANTATVVRLARDAAQVVLCYGVLPKHLQDCADHVIAGLRQAQIELWCFGKTQAGFPKHTLYLKGDTPLERF